MKNTIAIASAFLAATSFSTAEIVVNDFLSFEGFVDMSYSQTDTENGNSDESTNSYALDQVEISWLFDFDPVTAQIDLQYLGAGSDTVRTGTDRYAGSVVEQAFVTYHFDNGGAVTAGRYASMLGFEAFEPTGLYQVSFAYDVHDTEDSANTDVSSLPSYSYGVKYTHEGDNTFFGISLQDESWGNDAGRLGGDDNDDGTGSDSSYAVEIAGAYYMDNGLSFFLGGAYEAGDEDLKDTLVVNTYVTFETGAWLFAGELIYGETESGSFTPNFSEAESLQGLIMANFAYSDQASVTGRISYSEVENEVLNSNEEVDYIKYTLAHGYAFTDNLSLVNEISLVDGDRGNGNDYESVFVAAELIFSF